MRTVRAAALTLALSCLGAPALDAAAVAAPLAPALTSSGLGTAPQQAVVPVDGQLALISQAGELVTAIDLPDVGAYQVTGDTIVFEPALGFTGSHGVAYRSTDASGQTNDGTYTSVVALPPPPDAAAIRAGGAYGGQVRCLVDVPARGTVVLLDAAGQPTLDEFASSGELVADPSTGVLTFTPASGFAGVETAAYRVTDAYGQSTSATCTITVEAPQTATSEQLVAATSPAPAASPARTRGAAGRQQVAHLAVPAGARATLVDGGRSVLHVYRPGQGSYALDPVTETITFTPSSGFHGVGSVTYRVTDAYGRSAESVYRPTVIAAPRVHPRGRGHLLGHHAS